MTARGPDWRRRLARELTRLSRLDVADIAAGLDAPTAPVAHRIGLTGPPGAGKSTLIASLAQRRLVAGADIGVLAVDPTSPVSRGSLLGDRIRMEAVADDDRLFIRSVPSGPCHDGLCYNVVGLLAAMDAAGFSEVVLETVGVGQVSCEVRKLVDTLVLVLVPESGDFVQAMKAGILELADIYVVNKGDRPGAERMAVELRTILRRRTAATGWTPPVILTSAADGRGLEALDAAIDAHREVAATESRRTALEVERRRYRIRALLQQRFDELVATGALDGLAEEGAEGIFDRVIRHMRLGA